MIFFGEASVDQAYIIKNCLQRFCVASGSKISFAKTVIYFSNNTSPNDRNEISAALGITPTEDLGMYLGMPTITSRVTKDTFGYLCEKFDRRLSGWKKKPLIGRENHSGEINFEFNSFLCYADSENSKNDL